MRLLRAKALLFQTLFVTALDAPLEIQEDLRGIGVDLNALEAEYPFDTWLRALDIARARIFPDLTPDQADLELGRAYLRGYESTLLGSIVMTTIPLLSPGHFLDRYPRFASAYRQDADADVEVLGERSRCIVYRTERDSRPYMLAGLLLECLERLGTRAKLEITERAPETYGMKFTW